MMLFMKQELPMFIRPTKLNPFRLNSDDLEPDLEALDLDFCCEEAVLVVALAESESDEYPLVFPDDAESSRFGEVP